MNPNPLVSVLVPVYNVELYIEQCVRALFSQTYSNLEYIFIDDYSQDDSIKILRSVLSEYPLLVGRVNIISHECNRGLAAARNTAIEYASGEWILMADSDDWIEPETVNRLVQAINTEMVDLVTCNYYEEYPDYHILCEQKQIPRNGTEWIKINFGGEYLWSVWNKLIRRSLFKDYHIYAIEGANMGEDFVTTLRLACHVREVRHIAVPLIHYRLRGGSISNNPKEDKNQAELYQNMICVTDYIQKQGLMPLFMPELCVTYFRYKADRLILFGFRYIDYVLNIYPESHRFLWNPKIKIPLNNRLIIWCGLFDHKFLLKILLFIRNVF